MARVKPPRIDPGGLWDRIDAVYRRALERGALRPIATTFEYVEEAGIRFLVRVVDSLARKHEALAQERQRDGGAPVAANPFLPVEPDLLVGDASATHRCVLNKFQVVDGHLLIVTREFEDQDALLTEADFAALLGCMAQYESLGFYNAGRTAGASQRHKHLQLVPLPLTPRGPLTPMDPVLEAAISGGWTGRSPALPYPHVVSAVDPAWWERPEASATVVRERYLELLRAAGLPDAESAPDHPHPYNLLITRRWMLVVPRSREFLQTISVNSLGFAGALLARDERELALFRERGPLAVLAAVAGHAGRSS